MLDPHLLRHQADQVAAQLQTRGCKFDAEAFLLLDEQRKSLQVSTQALQNERNQRSKDIGLAKSRKEDTDHLMADVGRISTELDLAKSNLAKVLEQIDEICLLEDA